MDKQPKNYNKLIVASIIAIIAGIILSSAMYLISNGKLGVYKNSTGWHYSYDKNQEQIKEGIMPLSEFENINISISFSDLILEPSDKYELEYRYNEAQGQFDFVEKNNTFTITQKNKSRNMNFQIINTPNEQTRNTITLRYPKDATFENVDIVKDAGSIHITGLNTDTLIADSSFGASTLKEISATKIKIVTDSGKNTFENIQTDILDVSTSFGTNNLHNISVNEKISFVSDSGTILLDSVVSPYLSLNSSFGTITGKNLNLKGFDMDSDSGNISLEGKFTGKTSIDSSFGSIKLTVDGDKKDYSLDIQRDFGTITVDNKKISGNLIENINSDDSIILNSDSGNVSISFK